MNYTHILLTYTGSKVKLTEEQHGKFIDFGLADEITLDGHLIKGNNISEIVPLDKYYQDHPQERQEPEYQMLEAPKAEPMNRERYINACRSTLKGLRQYIDESPNPSAMSLTLAKKLVKKIEDAKSGVGEFPKSQVELINQLT